MLGFFWRVRDDSESSEVEVVGETFFRLPLLLRSLSNASAKLRLLAPLVTGTVSFTSDLLADIVSFICNKIYLFVWELQVLVVHAFFPPVRLVRPDLHLYWLHTKLGIPVVAFERENDGFPSNVSSKL